MAYLISSTDTYVVGTVEEALALRERLAAQTAGELISFSYNTKQIKAKGEVVDEYQVCKAKIAFQPEKSPTDSSLRVTYVRAGEGHADIRLVEDQDV